MNIDQIRDLPTTYDNVHESVYKSYQILQEVKRLLDLGTPGAVVRELITEMEKKSLKAYSDEDTNVKP